MTNEEFLVIMQKILSTKENRELFLKGYCDYARNRLKPNFNKGVKQDADTREQKHNLLVLC